MMLDAALDQLARAYPGPGGACAVLRRGEVRVRHCWGWANAERRIRFTPQSLFRVCSITKHFTCAALLTEFPEPSVLDPDVRARLPALAQPAPTSDAYAAALDLLAAALGVARVPSPAVVAAPAWTGAYVEPETGLVARIDTVDGHLRLRYGQSAERLELGADGTATSAATRLLPNAGGVWMERRFDNQRSLLRLCDAMTPAGQADTVPGLSSHTDLAGRYHCAELDSDASLIDAGGILYGAFSGFLGQGRMEMLERVGNDVWLLPCPRALDHTAPGDWTLAFRRDSLGRVDGITIGCWLARGIRYQRVA
jgi:hypothetical protein